MVRGGFLRSTMKNGRNTHIRNILHICQVYFACRLSHIWSLENILHFHLLVSRNKIVTLTLSIEAVFFWVFLRGWQCVGLGLVRTFRNQRFHVRELFLDLRQHLFAHLKLDGARMMLDRQSILREELYKHMVFRIILLLTHLNHHEFLLLFITGL